MLSNFEFDPKSNQFFSALVSLTWAILTHKMGYQSQLYNSNTVNLEKIALV